MPAPLSTILGTTLGTTLGTDLSTTDWEPPFDERMLYGLSQFSAANFFQTQPDGGEAGVATGFGSVVLAMMSSLAVGRFLSRFNGVSGHDIDITSGGVNIRGSVADGAATSRSATMPTAGSDVGKILAIALRYDGAGKLTLMHYRGAVSASVNFTGYTAAAASERTLLGLNSVALTTGHILSALTWRGVPSDEQLRALFDQARTLGDLPATFPLGTATDADIAALAPRHWYRPDTFTPSGGDLGALLNRNATVGGQLNVAAGTIALPAADAALNGQPSLVFSKTQRLQSSFSVSEFAFLQTRSTIVLVLVPTDFSSYQSYVTTQLFRIPAHRGATLLSHTDPNLIWQDTNGSSPIISCMTKHGPAASPDVYIATVGDGVATLLSSLGGAVSATLPSVPTGEDPVSTLNVGAGAGGGLTEPSAMRLADLMLFNRPLNAAEIQSVRDYARIRYGIGQITTTHRWSLRDVLRAVNQPVIDGELAPASLPDTVTQAAIDRMDRQGSPVVRVIDASVDGRKSYGAMGFANASLYLTTAPGAGIRGSAAGFTVRCAVTFQSIAAGIAYFANCANTGATNGWSLQRNAASLVAGTGTGSVSRSVTVPLTASDLNIKHLLHWVMDGAGVLSFYYDGVFQGASAAAAWTAAAASVPMNIGVLSTNYNYPATNEIVWELAGGHYIASAAEVSADFASWKAQGQLAPIPGKPDLHSYPITQDIIANGGPQNGIPAQVLDRIGTDHLTRVGGWKVSNNGLVSGEVPGATTQTVLRTAGSAFPGATSPWVVEFVWYDDGGACGSETYVNQSTFNTTVGWTLTSVNTTQPVALVAQTTTVQVVMTWSKGSAMSSGVHVAHVRYDGSQFILFVDGTAVSASATGLVFSPALTEPLIIGGHRATNPVNPIITKRALGATVYSGSWSDSEIATAANAAISAGKPVGVAGKNTKQWRIPDDIAEVGGKVPALIKERISGVDHMVVIGAPLQVASRTERLWSYEAQPLLYGTGNHSLANKYTASNGGAGNVASFGGTLVWRPNATTVSATRVLVSAVAPPPTRGWDIRTNGTNATVSATVANAANTGVPSGAGSLTNLYGKTCVISFQFDATAGRLRLYLNRVEVGTGVVAAGYAPPLGGITWGAELSGATAPGTDSDLFGFVLWDGLATLAQVQSQHDAILANDGRIQPMPGVTNTMMIDATADALANGGQIPALEDRIGNNDFTKQGSPSVATQFARVFGF